MIVEYKVGDKVICINDASSFGNNIRKGKIYVVTKLEESFPDKICIDGDIKGVYAFFKNENFMSIKEIRKEKLKKIWKG